MKRATAGAIAWLALLFFCALPRSAEAQGDLPIYAGQRVTGLLTTSHPYADGSNYHQHYLYQGVAGERVLVEASAIDFQVAIAIYPNGANVSSLADHGGEWLDEDWDDSTWVASVTATLPTNGQYIICVHSHKKDSVGSYVVYLGAAR